MGGVRRRPEAGARRAPASLLDARHGDGKLGLGGDEHGDVEDSILLRADELLAVVEQDLLGKGVDDAQLRHGARLADLLDPEPARERLLEREVRRARIRGRKEGTDDDPTVLDGLAELEGLLGCGLR